MVNGFTLLTDEELEAAGLHKGSIGPKGLPGGIKVIGDVNLKNIERWVVGANEDGFHFVGAKHGEDFQVDEWADLSLVMPGDACPKCGAALQGARGIEVSQVFQLGDKYSKTMGAVYSDENGVDQNFLMGCYGVGVSRTLAAIVEQHNDEDGIIWPMSVAPAHVCVIPLTVGDEEVFPVAERIAKGQVPAGLQDKEIFLLDLTSLVAGTQFRGQFEQRVKGLLSEVKAAGNVILFIDEIHTITSAGESEGAMNAGNILKPALSRGEIQVIGATTFNEYRKYIEKDQALERRFQPVRVEEPSVADTLAVMGGIKHYYEEHHHVQVPADVLNATVTLSERYITDRYLPDKAIDLLDEACACCNLAHPVISEYLTMQKELEALKQEEADMENADVNEPIDYERVAERKTRMAQLERELPAKQAAAGEIQVTMDDVAKVIELWTGIPAVKIRETEYAKLAGLETELKKKIIGQDDAVHLVAQAVKRSRADLSGRRRPASFIFVGPTGVGKTELVKQLANQLFDGPDPLIRLDMSEYMEKYAVSRMIGSPPGYVGYEEAGQLTEKVRRRPYSVVLFDEIEKAHPDVMNILLQILDEGKINDAQGRTVDFSNTVICMTSNAGSSDQTTASLGFNRSEEERNEEKSRKALSQFLRPEFLGRVDEVITFKPLSEETLQGIAALMLDEYKPSMEAKGIAYSYTPAALKALVTKSQGGKFGARDLRRVIRKAVEDPAAERLIDGTLASGSALTVDADADGEVVLK